MRFNKENLKAHIVKECDRLESIWGFDPCNGYSQVMGSEMARILAYGEYKALNDLYDSIIYNNIGEE